MSKAGHLLAFALTVLLPGNLLAQGEREAYVCLDRAVNGFVASDPSGNNFRPSEIIPTSFTMVRFNQTLVVKRPDRFEETYACYARWSRKPHLLDCTEKFSHISFDVMSGRYSRADIYGFIDNSPDSMLVAYGICQRM